MSHSLLLTLSALFAIEDAPRDFTEHAYPLLRRYCFSCHNAERHKGGVDLTPFENAAAIAKEPDLWDRARDALFDRTMPPEDRRQPSEDERALLIAEIASALESNESILDPGPGPIQRLTSRQYNNTIRDLLGVTTRPADSFPTDGGGGGGFDNNAATLFVPPILLERYLEAATDVLDRADPARYVAFRPEGDRGEGEAARLNLKRFAARALRRPPQRDELDRLLGLFQGSRARGASFEEAHKLPIKATLISPHFLFIVEREQPSDEPYPVDGYELAARLSYFLWCSTPDEELLDLAGKGELSRPDVLEAQVRRMLADPKADEFFEDFAGQWLGIGTLRVASEPDRRLFPEYVPELREAMIAEPVQTFRDVIRSDRSLLELLDSDSVYVNEVLAKHYGISGVTGPEFRRVPRPDADRGGVLGMAGVLTLTSYPQRTSPVLRGKWVLEELLGTPPPPPPPNVGVLSEDDRPKDGLTFRQRLEQHRSKPQCAGCHSKLDPIGFGLEGFDPIGRKRAEIGGQAVDAKGMLASGESFEGAGALKTILMQKGRDDFQRNLARRMLAYALRRGIEPYDSKSVKDILAEAEAGEWKGTSFIIAVAKSYPFLHRRNHPIRETQP